MQRPGLAVREGAVLLLVRGFIAFGCALAVSCAVDALAGVWLWHGRGARRDPQAREGAGLLGLGAGFALPGLVLPVPIRVLVILRTRRHLRRAAVDKGP